MKRIFTTFFFLFCCLFFAKAQTWELNLRNDYAAYFAEAYSSYPAIPRGVLESVAYTNTRIRHLPALPESHSCLGLPHYHGVMGLVEDGKGYFNNNLLLVAELSGYSVADIKNDPRINILAYAKAYQALLLQHRLQATSSEAHITIFDALTEIPNDGKVGNRFAFESQLYSIYKNLNSKEFQQAYQLPAYDLDLAKIFGEENYKVLSAAKVLVSDTDVSNEAGKSYSPLNIQRNSPPPCSDVSTGFAYPIIAAAADPSNYSSRNGTAITHVTIHTMQGSYSGSISWFQNPSANVSAHYNIRASDGQISQSVCEIDKAWHVSNSNPYAIGIEHEGYVDDASWYTDAMYRVSAALTKDIAARRSISLKRTYDRNGDNGLNPISDGCFKIKGHQHFPSQTHVDPGQYWDWNRYYDLLNPTTTVPTNNYTSCSGTFNDPGGAASNYGNDERSFYLIAPTGASSVTLSFSSFNLELNYDYLYVYDGDSYNDSLIAILNGTTIPAAITGRSGKLFLEFRTDCATTAAGWAASWTCSTTAPLCDEPSGLNETQLSFNQVRLDWNDVAGATGYQVKFKQSLAAAWQYYNVTSSEADITGLARDGNYLWQVKTLCSGGNSSAWVGREFVNSVINNTITSTLCSGRFTDMGGELGNYRNAENYTMTIAPTGATSVTLSFSSFNTEANYDLLRIYDGSNTSATLLGTYSGTTLPPTITSSGGSLTLRFTSDNWTNRAGWVANWTCQQSASGPVFGDTVLLNANMTANLNCGIGYHLFYDSGGSAGLYGNNENYAMTFCNPDTTQAVRLSFRPNPAAAQQLSLSSTTTGNDYLYIYNGANTNANLVGVYTGASAASPQPGSFISSGGCVTVKMESDNATNTAGWIARLYCSARPTVQSTVFVGGSEGNKTFRDSGGAGGNYGNNENYVITYRPHASAPAGQVIWADFSALPVGLEYNWDYLYVYDGPNTNARLIAVYTGDSSNSNSLGIIKASAANSSGALTFQFFSDGATPASGWDALITTGAARLAYGTDDCANATAITEMNATYAGSTMTATGRPSNADPSLSIALASLPQCSGVNAITRLENTVWYRFETPAELCNSDYINIRLDNISCQSQVANGSGVQFVLYEHTSCQTAAAWGTPLFCADKLLNGDTVNIAPYLLPGRSYYIMMDGFAGQHCNFDLKMEAVGTNPNGCIVSGIDNLVEPVLELRVYPNPATNSINFEMLNEFESPLELFFYDMTGKEIFHSKSIMNKGIWKESFDINSLAPGIYAYQLLLNGKSMSGRFEKN